MKDDNGDLIVDLVMLKTDAAVGCQYTLRHPRYTVTNVSLSLLRMSLKSADLRAPKRAVFAAGVFLTAAQWLRAVDAGESPYGGGETGEAGAGTGVRKRAWFSVPEKGRFWRSRVFHAIRVGGESADGSSAGSRTRAPGLNVGSVGSLRCVALLCAVSCESVLSTQVGPTVYGA
jgi:hypothetical protein